MKTKTDLYTKVVLTAIAIFLGIIIVKDIDFVSKAQASEVVNLNVEKAAEDDKDITFFIYENSKIKKPFSNDGTSWENGLCEIGNKDIPTHIVTTKKASRLTGVAIKRYAN